MHGLFVPRWIHRLNRGISSKQLVEPLAAWMVNPLSRLISVVLIGVGLSLGVALMFRTQIGSHSGFVSNGNGRNVQGNGFLWNPQIATAYNFLPKQ